MTTRKYKLLKGDHSTSNSAVQQVIDTVRINTEKYTQLSEMLTDSEHNKTWREARIVELGKLKDPEACVCLHWLKGVKWHRSGKLVEAARSFYQAHAQSSLITNLSSKVKDLVKFVLAEAYYDMGKHCFKKGKKLNTALYYDLAKENGKPLKSDQQKLIDTNREVMDRLKLKPGVMGHLRCLFQGTDVLD
jgi:hypothetical protein